MYVCLSIIKLKKFYLILIPSLYKLIRSFESKYCWPFVLFVCPAAGEAWCIILYILRLAIHNINHYHCPSRNSCHHLSTTQRLLEAASPTLLCSTHSLFSVQFSQWETFVIRASLINYNGSDPTARGARLEMIFEMWNVFMRAGIIASLLDTLLIISIANCFQLLSTKHLKFEWLVWRKMGRVRDKRLRSQLRPSLSLLSSARLALLGFDDCFQQENGFE